MPQPRYRLVDTQATPYYHCVSRCVRRAFLCGYDRFSRKNFNHRKQWILDRVKELSSVFAIDVCAFAIMSNHFHLVLHIDTNRVENWTIDQVIDRWLSLFGGPVIAHRYKAGIALAKYEQDALSDSVDIWRARLSDLSWYMRCLNESIARMANKEDNCTGRFWEGRFRSQALLDEAALVSCMTYVDLNPIRANMCNSLEQSDFTSIQERIKTFTHKQEQPDSDWLAPMTGNEGRIESPIPVSQKDYLVIVNWTGRVVRSGNSGVIPAAVKPILRQLGVKETNWVKNTQYFGNRFGRALGPIDQIKNFADRIGQKWLAGQAQIQDFYI